MGKNKKIPFREVFYMHDITLIGLMMENFTHFLRDAK
jgi:hypothetical protein